MYTLANESCEMKYEYTRIKFVYLSIQWCGTKVSLSFRKQNSIVLDQDYY